MRCDTAIGHDQSLAFRHELDVVGADAPGVEFPDPFVTAFGGPDANDASRRAIVVFRCEEDATVA